MVSIQTWETLAQSRNTGDTLHNTCLKSPTKTAFFQFPSNSNAQTYWYLGYLGWLGFAPTAGAHRCRSALGSVNSWWSPFGWRRGNRALTSPLNGNNTTKNGDVSTIFPYLNGLWWKVPTHSFFIFILQWECRLPIQCLELVHPWNKVTVSW